MSSASPKCPNDPKLRQYFNSKEQTYEGLAYEGPNRVNSYIKKTLSCTDISNFLFYKDLYAVLCDLNIYNEAKTDDESKMCNRYLVNLVEIDVHRNWKSKEIIGSFRRMLAEFNENKIFKPFKISVKSFAHSHARQQMVFTGIEDMSMYKIDEKFLDKKPGVFQGIATSLYESFVSERILLTADDLKEFNNLGVDTSKHDTNLKITYPQYTVVLSNTSAFSLLGLKNPRYTPKDRFFLFSKGKKKTVPLFVRINFNQIDFDVNIYDPLEIYTVFICRKYKLTKSCANVSIKDFDSENLTLVTEKETRVEVEFQETSFVLEDVENKPRKRFFEIFFVLVPTSSPGIIPNVAALTKVSTPIQYEGNFLFCETDSKLVSIFKINSDEAYHFSMENIPMRFKDCENLFQVQNSFLFDEKQVECQRPNTKKFLLMVNKQKVLFTTDEKQNVLRTVTVGNLHQTEPLKILRECQDVNDNEIYMDEKKQSIIFNSHKGIYPTEVLLKLESDGKNTNESQDFLYPTCVQHLDEPDVPEQKIIGRKSDEFAYAFSDEKVLLGKFRWNFNIRDDDPEMRLKRTIVYVGTSDKRDNTDFQFERFVLPMGKTYVLFISFTKDTTNDKYLVDVVYYNKDKVLQRIVFPGSDKQPYKVLPVELVHNQNNSSVSSKLIQTPLKNLETVFLNEKEIVYQIEIPNFQECNPELETNTAKTNLTIKCSFGKAVVALFGSLKSKVFGSNTAPQSVTLTEGSGLKRVTDQAKPIDGQNTGKII